MREKERQRTSFNAGRRVLQCHYTADITLYFCDLANKQRNDAKIGSNNDVVLKKDAMESHKKKEEILRNISYKII